MLGIETGRYYVSPEPGSRSMVVDNLRGGKPKHFADFLREKSGLSSADDPALP